MKNGLIRKIQFLSIVICLTLLLAGYIIYQPKLRNADKPFIELNGGDGDSIGNAQKAAWNAYDDQHLVVTPTSTPMPVDDSRIRVIVNDETVGFGDFVGLSFDDFKEKFESGALDSKEIILVDNYAEARTFKKIIKLFERAGRDYEIETEK